MITVFQFISSLSDGGAETLVKDYGVLFKRHPDLQVRCIIVTLHCVKNSANYLRLKDSGVEIVSIYKHHNPLISLHRRILGGRFIPNKLRKIIKQYNPDVIHVHLGLLKYIKKISKDIGNIKLFYTCHNEPSVMFGHNNGEKEAASFLIKHNNLKIIALHDEMRIQLNAIFGNSDTVVVNNGVDIAAFQQVIESKEEIRNSLNIPKHAFVIGHIGRFSIQKNHSFLIKIFAHFNKVQNNSYLILIGNGPTKKQILKEAQQLGIKDNIIILSNRTDIPRLLKCMDVFLFPSLFEGLSVTLVEAQAAGLRCVISDTINPHNILSPKTIQISLDNSIDTWCDAIEDTDRRNSFNYELSEFDIHKSVKHLSYIYNN